MEDPIFQPLHFRNLTVRNRIFRSSISGRIDNYDGSGTPARISWETRFAKGGVGAIISSHIPVDAAQRILPNYAMIDRDDRIPFWSRLVAAVHAYDCRFIGQLSMSGRQQDSWGGKQIPDSSCPCQRRGAVSRFTGQGHDLARHSCGDRPVPRGSRPVQNGRNGWYRAARVKWLFVYPIP
ncbi:oxidoreductase [Dyadobacter fermentans]|uniref:oxidoreductase n=1 Tax=Dyadobacter fermentans TaxID=94254 RepID=UPI00019B6199|nr:hypothetical protein [Dyadobacter fermentans]